MLYIKQGRLKRNLAMLNRTTLFLATLCLLAACQGTGNFSPKVDQSDIPAGFQAIDIRGLDDAYIAPDADLRAYTAILLPPIDVDNAKIEQLRSARIPHARDWELTEKDKSRFQKAYRELMVEKLTADNGFSMAEAEGENTLQVDVTVTKIAPNAPKDDFDSRPSARSRYYSEGFGDVSISLSIKDSLSGKLLITAVDKKRGDTLWRVNNSVTNWEEVRRMLRSWSSQIRNGLDDLKAGD
jgi:Protein of unknown function (DUF3313)